MVRKRWYKHMKKRKIICISILIIVIMSAVGSALCCNRYKQPEKKVHGKEESFVCNGIQYTLKNIEMYSFYDAMSKYNMTTEDLMFGEEYLDWADNKKVFIGEIEINVVSEDYKYDINSILGYNECFVSSSHEYDFERKLNEKGYKSFELKKGDKKTIYVAYSLIDYAFFEKTWNDISEKDVSIYVYDTQNCEYHFMNIDGIMP